VPSEIHLAFAHPSERAAASSADLRDRISLRDHVVEVEIGAFQAERGTTQRVRFNVVVEVRSQSEPLDDDVDRILSYDKVTEAISDALAQERLNLLETLAERVAERILAHPMALRTFVRIEKLDRGPGALGVEIVRARDAVQAVGDANPEAPRIVHLSNDAIASDHVTKWLAQLEHGHRPVILCVGAPDLQAPVASHPLSQRRVDLLAIEQNAWVLAARVPHCKVVHSRTELDWAMRNGQTCIWAPSKIVLDAVDGPGPKMDPVGLSRWFAALFEVEDVVFLDGQEGPELHL
jgi:dihydroneopterin aldolase